jgi:hypothetical protein
VEGFRKMKQATEEKRKILLEKQTQKVKRNLLRADKRGYYPKIRGYQICSKCLKKKVGSLNAWFQDFTGQKRICYNCIKNERIFTHFNTEDFEK